MKQAKAIAVEKGIDEAYKSYRIDFGDDMILWFDAQKSGEYGFTGDWNMYIFHTDNERDMQIKAFQEYSNDEAGAVNYMRALEAIEDYELNQK